MKYILAPWNRGILERHARSSVVVGFDYDGTLAPIVEDRDRASLRPSTRELLANLAAKYPCAVISGRARSDLVNYLAGIPLKHLVGNHGLETAESPKHSDAFTWTVSSLAGPMLKHIDGIDIEAKNYSVSIHYRRAPDWRSASEEITRILRTLPVPMRIIPGKSVVNVLPAFGPNKGTALEAIRVQEQANAAIYVGDDVTDEDVFQPRQDGRILGIRVGKSKASAAKFYVRDQLDVDVLLRLLLRLRA